MGMVFCRGCGQQIHESAITCPKCGAPNGTQVSASPQNFGRPEKPVIEIPPGVKGWSWGAFLLNFIWAIGNKTWIGLLVLVPIVGWVMLVMLGIKGREWAWKNNKWESLEHFNEVQRKWSFWGVTLFIGVVVLATLSGIGMAMYEQHQDTSQYEGQTESSLANRDFTNLEVPAPSPSTEYMAAPAAEAPSAESAQIEQEGGGLYEWKSGWGQGVSEYSVNDGNGNGLYIACPNDGEGEEGAVSATASIGGTDFYSKDSSQQFDVVVDGETYSNPFGTSSRAGANNFPYFWAALRKANNISVVAKDKSARIPVNGITKVLLSLESKENPCRVAW